MQVSAIVPILLNIILSEQQSQKQNTREQVDLKDIVQAQRAASPATGGESESTVSRHRAGETAEPLLVPLPLKSTPYPETQFFIYKRQDEEKQNPAGGKDETVIVFSLATTNLGRLFFMLKREADKINIQCHSQNADTAARLNSRRNELTEKLRENGFEYVVFRCTVLDPKLSEQPAGFSSPGLLDLKV